MEKQQKSEQATETQKNYTENYQQKLRIINLFNNKYSLKKIIHTLDFHFRLIYFADIWFLLFFGSVLLLLAIFSVYLLISMTNGRRDYRQAVSYGLCLCIIFLVNQ